MCTYPIETVSRRAYDYSALAQLREKQAIRCLQPGQKSYLRAAARYARNKATKSALASAPSPLAEASYACGPECTALLGL